MRGQDEKLTKKAIHIQRLRKPRPKDTTFLKRLEMGPISELVDPEKTIETQLSRNDKALLAFKIKGSKNHSILKKGKGKKERAVTKTASVFNQKHQEVAYRTAVAVT